MHTQKQMGALLLHFWPQGHFCVYLPTLYEHKHTPTHKNTHKSVANLKAMCSQSSTVFSVLVNTAELFRLR